MPNSRGRSRRSGGRWDAGAAKRYPRSVRVNEILREVLADELERMEDTDERLGLLTVTAVQCDPDLRHALVLFSSLGEEEERALAQCRVRLQAAVSTQIRLKRTPLLRFAADPAVAEGLKIEEILRRLPKGSGVSPTTQADQSDEAGAPADG